MDIFKLAQNFVTQPNTTKLNLIIFGNTGVGKTYLSECILNCALSNNKNSIPNKFLNIIKCALDEIGKNSPIPCTIPNIIVFIISMLHLLN